MYYESINAAEAIPYRNFKDKIKIVKKELEKNRKVEVIEELGIIYSREKEKLCNTSQRLKA